MKTTLWIAAALLVAGCNGKPDVTDQFTDLGDEKSDTFSTRLKLLGSLREGESSTVRYTKTPTYRGYKVAGQAGDTLDITVTSSAGDPVTWLLDSTYAVVARNDDADATTTDSHISATLGASGTYYVVFRDYYLESHYFTTHVE